jgi:hypothetical protein
LVHNMKMDVKQIPNGIDLRLNLLAGDSLYSDNIEVIPFTLREIKDVGYSNYMKHLGILTLDKSVLTDGDKSLDKYSILELIVLSKNKFLIDTFSEALCLFLREQMETLLVNNTGFIFNGRSLDKDKAKIIDNDSLNDILQIVKYQNCMINTFEEYRRPNPADDFARSILEKFKKADEKVAIQKSKEQENSVDGQEIDFSDIVSSVSTKSTNYNKQSVWGLTIYQMYDEYKRLEAISGYELNLMAMVQGAKIDNLKHWSSRIES